MKTPEEIVDSIPEEMRGHVFHLLGKVLHHKDDAPKLDKAWAAGADRVHPGGVTANDTTGDDSGGNGPPPQPHG